MAKQRNPTVGRWYCILLAFFNSVLCQKNQQKIISNGWNVRNASASVFWVVFLLILLKEQPRNSTRLILLHLFSDSRFKPIWKRQYRKHFSKVVHECLLENRKNTIDPHLRRRQRQQPSPLYWAKIKFRSAFSPDARIYVYNMAKPFSIAYKYGWYYAIKARHQTSAIDTCLHAHEASTCPLAQASIVYHISCKFSKHNACMRVCVWVCVLLPFFSHETKTMPQRTIEIRRTNSPIVWYENTS